MAPGRAEQDVESVLRFFPLLADTPAVFEEWRRLVAAREVSGKQVHDTRLVAVMLAHGVTHLLTLNPNDFSRFPEITLVHPADVPSMSHQETGPA